MDDRTIKLLNQICRESFPRRSERRSRWRRALRVAAEPKDLPIRLASEQPHANNQPDELLIGDAFAVTCLKLITGRTVNLLLGQDLLQTTQSVRIVNRYARSIAHDRISFAGFGLSTIIMQGNAIFSYLDLAVLGLRPSATLRVSAAR
ncbi:MAG: hypothetical protein RIK87_08575 [Fuerstiella sp.]